MSTVTVAGVELVPLYHVPRSQVWEGSGGRQAGKVHLHVVAPLELGRIKRQPRQALCGRRGWYERPAEGEDLCPRCEEIRGRIEAAA